MQQDSVTKGKSPVSEFAILHELYRQHLINIKNTIGSNKELMIKSNTTELKTEMWFNIFSYLTVPDLYRIMLISTFFKSLADDDAVWHQVFCKYTYEKAVVLKKNEKNWKLKFKYECGFIEKAMMVEKLSGVLWNTWTPCFLVLSGSKLIGFFGQTVLARKNEFDRMMSKNSLTLHYLLNQDFVKEYINMKNVRIFKGTRLNSGGMQRFGVSYNNVDYIYRASEKDTEIWLTLLVSQIHSLSFDFSLFS